MITIETTFVTQRWVEVHVGDKSPNQKGLKRRRKIVEYEKIPFRIVSHQQSIYDGDGVDNLKPFTNGLGSHLNLTPAIDDLRDVLDYWVWLFKDWGKFTKSCI